jgi:putative SbcD/Mre11-related phosphoesterase
MLIISDLHVGWEMALSSKGIHVPSQMPKILARLLNILSEYKPDRLLILGDVKHTIATAEIGEWHDIPDLFNELKTKVRQILLIRGNHDGNLEPLLPDNVELLPATGFVFGETGFFHGHQWPTPSILQCKSLVMGHVHPVVAFHDPAGFRITRQVWVKIRCDRKRLAHAILKRHSQKEEVRTLESLNAEPETIELLIMPSFNDFLGGRPLNESRLTSGPGALNETIAGPVLRSDAVDLENAETYLLDGTFLGTLSQLRSLG